MILKTGKKTEIIGVELPKNLERTEETGLQVAFSFDEELKKDDLPDNILLCYEKA